MADIDLRSIAACHTLVNTNLLAFRSGVDQSLRRSLAKAILVVAGELAEVGVARCERCLCDAVWPFPASFDESITREIETHRLQITHRRCRSKTLKALIDRASTYAADRHEVVCTNLASCVFSNVILYTTHIVGCCQGERSSREGPLVVVGDGVQQQ